MVFQAGVHGSESSLRPQKTHCAEIDPVATSGPHVATSRPTNRILSPGMVAPPATACPKRKRAGKHAIPVRVVPGCPAGTSRSTSHKRGDGAGATWIVLYQDALTWWKTDYRENSFTSPSPDGWRLATVAASSTRAPRPAVPAPLPCETGAATLGYSPSGGPTARIMEDLGHESQSARMLIVGKEFVLAELERAKKAPCADRPRDTVAGGPRFVGVQERVNQHAVHTHTPHRRRLYVCDRVRAGETSDVDEPV